MDGFEVIDELVVNLLGVLVEDVTVAVVVEDEEDDDIGAEEEGVVGSTNELK